jgi:hypothetical protein
MNEVEDNGAIAIGNTLEKNKNLTELILSNIINICYIDNNKIGDEGAISISKALSEDNINLTKLYLCNKYLLGR